MEENVLLQIKGLKKWFPVEQNRLFFRDARCVKAVDEVNLTIRRGEIMGLVGESGCGKSTLGRTVLRLLSPTGGSIIFNGTDITSLNGKQLASFRKRMQMIFQDPYASLDPRMTIADSIAEPADIMRLYESQYQRLERIVALMKDCGIDLSHINRYPHEFSGGQRQRIGIARALSVDPDFIVCDEPVSALDVSIQSQIINLLKDLQRQRGLTLLFITHDLGVVEYIADRIAVMYLGRIVELADKRELYANPMHPYTKALLASIPTIGGNLESSDRALDGDMPSPVDPPKGCAFCTRCLHATQKCIQERPELKELSQGHLVSCFFAEQNIPQENDIC